MSKSVVVSNGYGQFHLARLAENLERQGRLSRLLTGAYVPRPVQRIVKNISPGQAIRRLVDRGLEIPDASIRSFWPGELPHQLAQRMRHRGFSRAADFFVRLSLDGYASWASARLSETQGAGIYHFRAGMGGKSVEKARSMGMKTLCDHSIAHPRLLAGLVDGSGDRAATLNSLWSRVEADMAQADGVIVNSDFVASTCLAEGMLASKIRVAYTGVDPTFLAAIDEHVSEGRFDHTQVAFAGTLERRKGIDAVVSASMHFSRSDLEWSLIGEWEPDAINLRKLVPTYVLQLPKLPRNQLARILAATTVFVFPSRAEGSARVVAEALAAGCFVITTLNTGSIVRDGIDGKIVDVGDPLAIASAVREYLAVPADERRRISAETMRYARSRLSEASYTSSVIDAYEALAV
jgi:glycosyltransferase involved in cell wall biosynthesis